MSPVKVLEPPEPEEREADSERKNESNDELDEDAEAADSTAGIASVCWFFGGLNGPLRFLFPGRAHIVGIGALIPSGDAPSRTFTWDRESPEPTHILKGSATIRAPYPRLGIIIESAA
ncbi:hypothetical protein EU545_01900 [Candidatus Thorarchaeota archaeon]|nr:MAG: hypothetical protein EU545_01900 [Candidatus Thorarchaeota archaeon]